MGVAQLGRALALGARGFAGSNPVTHTRPTICPRCPSPRFPLAEESTSNEVLSSFKSNNSNDEFHRYF